MLAIIISSCGVTEADEFNRQYQITNTSDYHLTLIFFNTFSNTSFEVQLLEEEIYNGDLLTYRSGNPQLSTTNSFYPSSAYEMSDSLLIIFDNAKKLGVYYTLTSSTEALFSNPLERNLFRHGSYENNGNDSFNFKITNDDYGNAEDCEGNCE